MKKPSLKVYTIEDKRKVIIRDGVYLKLIDENKGFQADAYVVDFWGNIFYSEKAGDKKWILCDDQRFLQAKKDGFSCIRNLTDNEVFAMKETLVKLGYVRHLV